MSGIIALDIDGTITNDIHTVPQVVVDYLVDLAKKGWIISFVTGRSYSMAIQLDKLFKFPHYLIICNGAEIIRMPDKKILGQQYMPFSLLSNVEKILQEEKTDYIVYTGLSHDDVCYWRPSRHQSKWRDYLEMRRKIFQETYRAKDSFDDLPQIGIVALKCFNSKEVCFRVAPLAEKLPMHVTIVGDPIKEGVHAVVMTSNEADKGKSVLRLKSLINQNAKIIACGNDLNDISMLKVADIACVMDSAPPAVIDLAHILAPAKSESAIVIALKKAVESCV